MSSLYQSESEIQKVVRDFESCATPKDEFHHRHHLIVAVWYLQTLSPSETVKRIRSALLRFLDHHGVDKQKYSEEVTVFWVEAVASELTQMNADASVLEKCNQVIATMPLRRQARKPAARAEGEE